MKLSSLKNRKSISSISAIMLAGAIAVGQSGLFIAAADDTTSVTSAVCTSVNDYSVKLTGNFPEPVTFILVNYVDIARSQWSQTATSVVIKTPGGITRAPYNLIVYYGLSTAYLSVDVSCDEITTLSPDTTEDGGLLPDTGSNNYNYLATGLGLAFVGSAGLLRRKPVKA
jgi:LPXTG-motif cell wall-anchored protein